MKKILLFLLMMVLTIGVVSAIDITNCTEFDDIDNNLTADYTLLNDIDCGSSLFDGITGDYSGYFDGQGYTISNIIINSSSANTSDAIFEGLTGNGSIVNVIFDNITLDNSYAGLVYYAKSGHTGLIENVSISGFLDAESKPFAGTIFGLIESNGAFINNVKSTMDIICGSTANDACAGFIGVDNGANLVINNSYYDGSVTQTGGTSYTIGFLGIPNSGSLTINNSFSNAVLIGANKRGFFGSPAIGIFGNIFFNSDSSRANTTTDGHTAVDLTDAEMQTQANFTGFDFTNIWYMDTYPALRVFDTSTPTEDLTTFNSVWRTTTANESITLPLVTDGVYNFIVDWGDGNTSNVTTYNGGNETHTYALAGYYNVTINGTFEGWSTYETTGTRTKIYDISQWGNFKFQGGLDNRYFWDCRNLYISAKDAPDLSSVTSIRYMFANSDSLSDSNLSNWNTSSVTDMSYTFYDVFFATGANEFNGDISGWDVSSVIDMNNMFYGSAFNGNISGWDTSSVTNMNRMFYRSGFNQDISSWDTSSVTNMEEMFYWNLVFNKPLNGWNTSSVTTMASMFEMSQSFNQDLDQWDTSQVTDMERMFFRTPAFNGNITTWDTGKVTTMSAMFSDDGYSNSFNQDLSGWNTSSVINMASMFSSASAFNGNISTWDTSSVTDMSAMFYQASNFNQPLNNWDTSKVTTMFAMFGSASSFNQPLNNWDTSNVTNIRAMFGGASSFNQDLDQWDVSNTNNFQELFSNAYNFNGNISTWDTSKVFIMYRTFYSAYDFNQPLNNWNTSKVTDMRSMFERAYDFNQPLNNWNTSKVITYNRMFRYNKLFDQDISNFDIEGVTDVQYMFANRDISLSTDNYDALLNSWGSQTPNSGLTLHMTLPTYTSIGKVGRDILTDTYSWNIFDGGFINTAPTIDNFIPPDTNVSAYLGDTLYFYINASDLDNDTLYYSWYEDNVIIDGENSNNISWTSLYTDIGFNNITAKVNDSIISVQNEWNVSLSYYPVSLFYTNIADVTSTTIQVDFNTNADSVRIYLDDVLITETSLISYTIEGLYPNTSYNITILPIKDGFYGEPDTYTQTTDTFDGNAPIMINSSISPSTAYNNTILTGSCKANDIDTADLYYDYIWYVNETIVKSGTTSTASRNTFKSVGTLDSSNFVKNQNVTLGCVAHDGILFSSELNTTTTILNSPAEISSIFLIQLNATDYLCNHTYLDADNDPEITPQYEWFQNGLPTGTNTMSKAISDYNTSDEVYCQVTTGDGIADNVSANSSTYVVGDIGVPTLEVTNIDFTAYTDTAMYIEAVCTDDVGVASGFPVIRFTNPNLEEKYYSFLSSGDDTYYRYLTFPIAGTYTDVNIECCDGNSNCVNESRANIVASVRVTEIPVNVGGGAGGSTTEEPFRDITSFEVIPESISYSLTQGSRTIGQIQIKNTDIVDIRFSVYIVRDNETPEVYDWMEFDLDRKSDTFTLQPSGGLVTSDRYLSYYINVPEDAPVGQYQGRIEVSGLDQTGQMIININVREGLNLLGFLNIELFTLPRSENQITGDVIGGELSGDGRVVTLGFLLLTISLIIGGFFTIRYLVRRARK